MTMRRRTLLTLSLSASVSFLAAACGSDDSGEGPDTPRTRDAAAPRDSSVRDASERDAGASDSRDSGRQDSGRSTDAPPAQSETPSGRGIFDGDPECPDFDPHFKGSLDGKDFDYTPFGVSTVFSTQSFYTIDGVDDSSQRITYVQLEWNQSLSSGEPVKLTGGYVSPPPQSTGATFCILDGSIGLATKQMASGAVVQFEVTKIQPRVAGTCQGAAKDASFRGCTYRLDASDIE